MFDAHAVAQSLTEADVTPAQADALTDALRSAAEQDDHGTSIETGDGQQVRKLGDRNRRT